MWKPLVLLRIAGESKVGSLLAGWLRDLFLNIGLVLLGVDRWLCYCEKQDNKRLLKHNRNFNSVTSPLNFKLQM